MASQTRISWTDSTFNPWLGCTRISPGCQHCYAETLTRNRMGKELWGPSAPRPVTSDSYWRQPLKWNRLAIEEGRRIRVFCGSLCDWAEDHPTAEATRPKLWDLIRRTPALDWQLLTKRADRLASCLPSDWGSGFGNVWLGVSIENNAYTWRADHLRRIPATVRFVSYEPALGPLDQLDLSGIGWVLYGGESGPGFRPHDPQWARDMRARCRAAGVAFFFKQHSDYRTELRTTLDGQTIQESPARGLPLPVRLE